MKSALERHLKELNAATRETLFLPRLELLDERLIDLLANAYHVDNYDLRPLTISTKRAMIREAILDHRLKGTPAAVEKIMRYIFRTARIEEWFEYGGDPYRFRIWQDVTSDDESADFDTMERVRRAVDDTKNTRSWIDFYGFLIDFQDTQTTSDSNRMLIRQVYEDWYEYRRSNAAYIGEVDLGKYRFYDGVLSYGGGEGDDYAGFEAHGNFGQYQASDFEELLFILTLNLPSEELEVKDSNVMRLVMRRMEEKINAHDFYTVTLVRDMDDRAEMPRDEHLADISLRGWTEECAPTIESEMSMHVTSAERPKYAASLGAVNVILDSEERLAASETNVLCATLPIAETIGYHEELVPLVVYDQSETVSTRDELSEPDVRYIHSETIKARDENDALGVTISTHHDTIKPQEIGNITLYQEVRYGGLDGYDGAIGYAGTLTAEVHFLTASEREMWTRTRDRAILEYMEPCSKCGGSDYEYRVGSVRQGGERFLITDEQKLAVRIECASCGATLANYLVPEQNGEAIS